MEKFVCEECGGTDIQIKAWVDANTLEYQEGCDLGDEDDNWCEDCEEHTNIMHKDEYDKQKEENSY